TNGSSRPSDALMAARVSAEIVSGSWLVGSPGARSSTAKMMKLMTSNVGIATRTRRIRYWVMSARRLYVGSYSPAKHQMSDIRYRYVPWSVRGSAGHGEPVTGAVTRRLGQSARYQSAMFHSSESHEFFAVPSSELALAETSAR